jgi:hypothetical protein
MDNKFMNLKKEYRDFVKKSAQMINGININDDLTKEKCADIFKLYQEIYNMIEDDKKLNINDINHIITNYSREDNDVNILKKFIKIKNLYVIKKIIKSPLWDSYIKKISDEINLGDEKLNKKVTTHIVSKGVYRLLNLSVEQFRGCWEIAEFKDNKIKKIDIIDPEHYDFLIQYIKNKISSTK